MVEKANPIQWPISKFKKLLPSLPLPVLVCRVSLVVSPYFERSLSTSLGVKPIVDGWQTYSPQKRSFKISRPKAVGLRMLKDTWDAILQLTTHRPASCPWAKCNSLFQTCGEDMFHKSWADSIWFYSKVRTPNCSDNTCSFYLGKSHFRHFRPLANVEAKCRGTEGIKDQGRIDLRNAGGHRDLGKTREKIRKALKHDDNIW